MADRFFPDSLRRGAGNAGNGDCQVGFAGVTQSACHSFCALFTDCSMLIKNLLRYPEPAHFSGIGIGDTTTFEKGEAPGCLVNMLARSPPVQDSAKARVSFL